MSSYLLPCSCGKSIPIDTSQAGQEVRCSCGQSQEVPTLRGIRQLLQAEQAVTQQHRVKKPWSNKRTIWFAVGLTTIAVGISGMLIVGVEISKVFNPGDGIRLPTKKEMKSYEEEISGKMISRMTPEETYAQFSQTKEMGLGEQVETLFLREHGKIDRLRAYLWKLWLPFALVGLLTTVIAAFWPRGYIESTEVP